MVCDVVQAQSIPPLHTCPPPGWAATAANELPGLPASFCSYLQARETDQLLCCCCGCLHSGRHHMQGGALQGLQGGWPQQHPA